MYRCAWHLKIWLWCWLPWLAWGLSTPWARAQAVSDAAALNALWAEHSRSFPQGAQWAVMVLDLDSGQTLLESNPDQRMIPASIMKLFTVGLALRHWGPDHRFQTELRRVGSLDTPSGVLAGDLEVLGGDSPGFGDRYTTQADQAFETLLTALQRSGVRRIEGQVRLISPTTDWASFGSGWSWDDLQEGYGAPVSPFIAMDNAVWITARPGNRVGEQATLESRFVGIEALFQLDNRVRTAPLSGSSRIRYMRFPGSNALIAQGEIALGASHRTRLAVPNPEAWFGVLLVQALESRGFLARGPSSPSGWASGPSPAGAGELLTTVPSASVAELASTCLKASNNLLAQWLLVQLGLDHGRRSPSFNNSATHMPDAQFPLDAETAGVQALHAFVQSLGVDRQQAKFEEGSGLSRKNLVTARTIAHLLLAMDRSPVADLWWRCMPMAGVDGTLATRFRDGPAQGRVRAKTGTLQNIGALAGEVRTRHDRRWALVILANNFVGSEGRTSPVREIDGWVEKLAAFGVGVDKP